VLGGPWVGILCHLDLPTWITHTALAVNNHPLYSLYNPLHVPSIGTSALQRLYSSTTLYNPLQLYSSTSSTVYIPLHHPSVGVVASGMDTGVFWTSSVVLSATFDGYHHPMRTGSESGASYTLRRLENEL